MRRHRNQGQAVVETAIVIPILILLVAGIVELGAAANEYMSFHDAAREAARFGANLDPELTSRYYFDARDKCNAFPDVRGMEQRDLARLCSLSRTTNFWYEVACLAYQNIPLGRFDADTEIMDDIVVTVIGVRDGAIVRRWPIAAEHRYPGVPGDPDCAPGGIPADLLYHFRGADYGTDNHEANPTCTAETPENCRAWSMFGNRGSRFVNADINSNLLPDAPATAFVIVEIYRSIPHFSGLFAFANIIPDPFPVRPYAIFPVSAAEPRD